MPARPRPSRERALKNLRRQQMATTLTWEHALTFAVADEYQRRQLSRGQTILRKPLPSCPQCGARTEQIATRNELATLDVLMALEPCGHTFRVPDGLLLQVAEEAIRIVEREEKLPTGQATNDLITFLRARLDEDKAAARAATPGPWEWKHEHGEPWQPRPDGWLDYSGEYLAAADGKSTLFGPGMTPHADANHIARHDPARVLADVEAKRRIIAEHHPVDPCDAHDAAFETSACDTLRLLALPYSDHPDYRDEWRP